MRHGWPWLRPKTSTQQHVAAQAGRTCHSEQPVRGFVPAPGDPGALESFQVQV